MHSIMSDSRNLPRQLSLMNPCDLTASIPDIDGIGVALAADTNFVTTIGNELAASTTFITEVGTGLLLDQPFVDAIIGQAEAATLQYWTETGDNTTSSTWTPKSATGQPIATNLDAVISPLGNRALQVGSVATGVPGSARGTDAVDLQRERSVATQVASGAASFVSGSQNTASGAYSNASGLSTKASGSESHAEGNSTIASGSDSHAEGLQTTASGNASHAEGDSTTASANSSHAEGNGTQAISDYCHSEGYNTTAGTPNPVSGTAAHAEGDSTIASGNSSHAEGLQTTASGNASHVEGNRTTASGTASHCEGIGATASGMASHAEGSGTQAISDFSHSEGYNTTAGTLTPGLGTAAHAEGSGTNATGTNSHAEGNATTASGLNSHAEGLSTVANGAGSHAEGSGTNATGDNSHAEGNSTTASGVGSHAGGLNVTVSGNYSFAHVDSVLPALSPYTIAATSSVAFGSAFLNNSYTGTHNSTLPGIQSRAASTTVIGQDLTIFNPPNAHSSFPGTILLGQNSNLAYDVQTGTGGPPHGITAIIGPSLQFGYGGAGIVGNVGLDGYGTGFIVSANTAASSVTLNSTCNAWLNGALTTAGGGVALMVLPWAEKPNALLINLYNEHTSIKKTITDATPMPKFGLIIKERHQLGFVENAGPPSEKIMFEAINHEFTIAHTIRQNTIARFVTICAEANTRLVVDYCTKDHIRDGIASKLGNIGVTAAIDSPNVGHVTTLMGRGNDGIYSHANNLHESVWSWSWEGAVHALLALEKISPKSNPWIETLLKYLSQYTHQRFGLEQGIVFLERYAAIIPANDQSLHPVITNDEGEELELEQVRTILAKLTKVVPTRVRSEPTEPHQLATSPNHSNNTDRFTVGVQMKGIARVQQDGTCVVGKSVGPDVNGIATHIHDGSNGFMCLAVIDSTCIDIYLP